jgi:hypothetical protein
MHETAPALQMLPGAYLSRLCHPTDAPGHPTVVQTIAALCSCSKPRQGTRMMQRIQAKVHSLPANKPHSRCACRGELCPVASDWSSPRQHLPDHGIRPPAGAVPIHTLRRLYGVWMAVLFLVVDGAVARGGWVDGGGGGGWGQAQGGARGGSCRNCRRTLVCWRPLANPLAFRGEFYCQRALCLWNTSFAHAAPCRQRTAPHDIATAASHTADATQIPGAMQATAACQRAFSGSCRQSGAVRGGRSTVPRKNSLSRAQVRRASINGSSHKDWDHQWSYMKAPRPQISAPRPGLGVWWTPRLAGAPEPGMPRPS